MDKILARNTCLIVFLVAMLLGVTPATSNAVVDGIYKPGANAGFNLFARDGQIQMGDGTVAYMWGYAYNPAGVMQYPGPTLIVDQGANVTVTLTNSIAPIAPNPAMNVSIVFPGQAVAASGAGTVAGLLTREAPYGTVVTYKFTASNPGTYTYYSGTMPDLQIEMGMIGTLIVRPTLAGPCATLPPDPNGVRPSRGFAYCTPDGYFDREYLFHVSEIDPAIHALVEFGNMAQVDMTKRHATAYFVNGRNLPDTMEDAFIPWMPNQPYNAMPMMHPGEKVLIRFVGGGSMMHPYHTHGQNHSVIARDGRLLTSTPLAPFPAADLQYSDFTTTNVPGETVDAIYNPWTGAKLGWDPYGHTGNEPGICTPATTDPVTHLDINTYEYCPDHGKPIPVDIPFESLLEFGQMYGGTPYLGVFGELPPVFVRQNLMGAYTFMWHSHNERELTTNNIFIGGMGTMAFVLPYTDDMGAPVNIP